MTQQSQISATLLRAARETRKALLRCKYTTHYTIKDAVRFAYDASFVDLITL